MSSDMRHVHVEQAWGTVVSIDVRLFQDRNPAYLNAVEEVVAWLHDVDQVFSTYKADSIVSQLRVGAIKLDDVDAGVADVVSRCSDMKRITEGTFDPWAVPGGFDPSGIVKGWAIDRAAAILENYGFRNFMINAGGDIVVRGNMDSNTPWRIGIQHPEVAGGVYGTVELSDSAIATSARYERGEHVVSPNGNPINAISATVVGPDAATADALATALLISGVAGLKWLETLTGYSGQVVVGKTVTSQGSAFN